MEITKTTTAPPAAIWALLADVEGWPSWSSTMNSVEPTDEEQGKTVGATYVVRQPRLPKAIWRITDWREDEEFTWESRAPGVRTVASHVLRPTADGGTTVTLGFAWDGPLTPVARLLYGRLATRYVETECASLLAAAERAG